MSAQTHLEDLRRIVGIAVRVDPHLVLGQSIVDVEWPIGRVAVWIVDYQTKGRLNYAVHVDVLIQKRHVEHVNVLGEESVTYDWGRYAGPSKSVTVRCLTTP